MRSGHIQTAISAHPTVKLTQVTSLESHYERLHSPLYRQVFIYAVALLNLCKHTYVSDFQLPSESSANFLLTPNWRNAFNQQADWLLFIHSLVQYLFASLQCNIALKCCINRAQRNKELLWFLNKKFWNHCCKLYLFSVLLREGASVCVLFVRKAK